jgi:hypothetical protein
MSDPGPIVLLNFARWRPGRDRTSYVKYELVPADGHCQSKFVYFAKMSEPDFAGIDFPAFFRVDLSGSMAATSI